MKEIDRLPTHELRRPRVGKVADQVIKNRIRDKIINI